MSFGKKDLEHLAEILKLAAEQEIMPRFRSLSEEGIREKSSVLDLVTDADYAFEAALRVSVAKAFPNALFHWRRIGRKRSQSIGENRRC